MIRRYIIWRNRNADDKTLRASSSAQRLPDAALAGCLGGPQARSSFKESLETAQNCRPALRDAQKDMASRLEAVVYDR